MGCPSCRHEITITGLTVRAACPHCDADLGVSQELADNITELASRSAVIAEHWREVAKLQGQRRRISGRISVLLVVGMVAAVALFGLGPLYLHSRGLVSEHTMGWLIPTGMLGSYVLILAAALVWYYVAPRRAATTPVTSFDELLSDEAVRRALAQADREMRRARLARFAQPRLAYMEQVSRSAAKFGTALVVGLIAGPLAGGGVWLTVESVRDGKPDDPAIWVFWPGYAIGVAIVVGWWLRRRARRSLILDVLGRLAADLGGRRLDTLADTMAWLNAHWAAPSPNNDFYAGPRYGGVAATVRGYPAMIDVELNGYSGDTFTFEARVVIYLAALLPPRSEPGVSTHPAGFTIEIDPAAGVVARATPPTVRELRRDPSRLGQLGPVLADLGARAALEGATAPSDEYEHEPGGRRKDDVCDGGSADGADRIS
jgi:hypothetical protein